MWHALAKYSMPLGVHSNRGTDPQQTIAARHEQLEQYAGLAAAAMPRPCAMP